MLNIHISYGVTDKCKNLEESYGEICVKCNKCGRFDEEEGEREGSSFDCLNALDELKEFIDKYKAESEADNG